MNSKPINRTITSKGNITFPAVSGNDSVFQFNTLDDLRFSTFAMNTISYTYRERFEIAFCPYDVTVKRSATIYTRTFSQFKDVAEISHCNPTITKNSPYPFTSDAGVDGISSKRIITVTLFFNQEGSKELDNQISLNTYDEKIKRRYDCKV